MDKIDLLAVKEMMYNDPCTEKEFFEAFKHTSLFKRTRAWISLKETFKGELDNSFVGKFARWISYKLTQILGRK